MLARPSTQVITALARLEGHPDFEAIRSWLTESLQDLDRLNRSTKDEVLSRWMQGAAQAVGEFLEKAEEARTVLRKSR